MNAALDCMVKKCFVQSFKRQCLRDIGIGLNCKIHYNSCAGSIEFIPPPLLLTTILTVKYAILIPDGCADRPIEALGNRTPMQVAKTPNLDFLAKNGRLGTSRNVPDGFSPGSDVATLGLLGYDPQIYYTGRAPLEAVAQGISLGENDWAIRCNLVCVENDEMQSFTAGHISSEEAAEIIETLNKTIGQSDPITFYSGVSYRNLAMSSGESLFDRSTQTFPPHDFTQQNIEKALPKGTGASFLLRIMEASRRILKDHPINRRRMERDQLPATQVWLWGLGKKPQLPLFAAKYADIHKRPSFRGAMITAVDLLRGIALQIGWDIISVPGITGYIDTNYAAKGIYAAKALAEYDIVCVHVEATDEAGHEGNFAKKIAALEDIDTHIVPPILDALRSHGEWQFLISPDHPTPTTLKTHTSDPVPWLWAGSNIAASNESAAHYDEVSAKNVASNFQQCCLEKGCGMMNSFLAFHH
ncbi:MAG: cofactor-independent phosphoglycerate mutase [Thermoguttaceae bacterium]